MPAMNTTFMTRSPLRSRTASIGSGHGKSNDFKEMATAGRNRLWFAGAHNTSIDRRRSLPLGRVVHLELDRVRGHAEALHLLVLEPDVRIDHVVGEDAAAREEGAVLVEVLERLVERR